MTNEELQIKLEDSVLRIEGLCTQEVEPSEVNLYAERALREAIQTVLKIRQESNSEETSTIQVIVEGL